MNIKKKILSMLFITVLGLSLAACGNGGEEKQDASTLEDYRDVPFSIYMGEGENITSLRFSAFPDNWKGQEFDIITYHEYFRTNYGLGAMEIPVVPEGTQLTMDFGGYQPDKITVRKDPNTFDVLSAKEEVNSAAISEVKEKDNSFTVEYGESNLLYYAIECQWADVGTVTYGIIVTAK